MNKTDKQRLKQQELVAHSLSQILAIFAEMLSKNMAAEIIPELPDLSQIQIPEPASLGPLEVLVKNSDYKVDALQKQLDILGTQHQLLDQANETNKLLGAQFYGDHIIEPMVRSLFPLCDLIDSARKKLAPISLQASMKNLEAIETQLIQFLAGYGIERFSHQNEEKFDPQIMKPLKTLITSDSSLDGRVAESLQPGFKKAERILRLETIRLYTTQHNNVNTL